MKYTFIYVLSALTFFGKVAQAQDKAQKRNIVFLLADDMRYDAVGYVGKTTIRTPHLDALAKDGTIFTHAYTTSAISCCSRAGILTGMYSRKNGIVDFSRTLRDDALSNTYPMLMKKNGYYVGFIGKYGVGSYLPQKEFNFWRGFSGQGTYYQKDKAGNEIHLTALISNQIDEFLESRNLSQPFCLSVSFKSPHTESEQDPFPYDKRYDEMYESEIFTKSETFGERGYSQFPDLFKMNGKWENEGHLRFRQRYGTEDKYQSSVKGYYRLIAGIDEAVMRLRDKLEKLGISENTIIIFTSDNGYYLGEHGLEGKWYGHEESIRLPLIIYDPWRKQTPGKISKMVLNIDLPSTMLDYADIGIPSFMQGTSLKPLVEGKRVRWRREFLYEHLMILDRKGWYVYIPQTEGIVTERYKYMRYFNDNNRKTPIYEELFNIKDDPLEKNNLSEKDHKRVKYLQKKIDVLIEQIQ